MDFDITLNRPFNSFKTSVSAQGLNKFVILTGRNGAGKSQLLQLLSSANYSSPTPEGVTTITIDGENVQRNQVLHLASWQMPSANPTSAAELNTVSSQVSGAINQLMQGNTDAVIQNFPTLSPKQLAELTQLVPILRSEGFDIYTNPHDFDRDIFPRLSSDFDNHTAEMVNERISRIIYKAHFTALDERRDLTREEDPIKVFNDLCVEFDMKFHLQPFETALRPYIPTLLDEDENRIDWAQLSAGEMVIFRIITWLFYHRQNHTLYPKLLLLDEPDAHLTPKMIRKFIDSIQNVLVNQMGIAVIMTTHSPNTVALVDEDALYELTRNHGDHSIEKITKHDALITFSEGLLFVQEKTKLVFLEGKADTPFYNKLYEIAVTKHGFSNNPSLKFMAVSEDDPDEGGCTKVLAMVRKFEGTTLLDIINGIIDRDKNNQPTTNVKVLNRYSIENYLYDPIAILVSLIRSGEHKNFIDSIAHIDTNDIEVVLTNSALLQSSIDSIITHLKSSQSKKLEESLVDCSIKTKFEPGILNYKLPKWFIDMKKSDLMSDTIWKNGQPLKPHITERQQYLAMDSAGFIHEDLYDLLSNLIG